jgi:hypothetical protein
MGLEDTIKQLMKGRSEMLERGIDTAVEKLSRFSTALEQRAESVKEKAREFDADRDHGTAAPSPPPEPGGSSAPTEAAPGPATGSSLRGDLADPEVEQPPVEGSVPPVAGAGPAAGGPPPA